MSLDSNTTSGQDSAHVELPGASNVSTRHSLLIQVVKAQVNNPIAEELGKRGWWLPLLVVFLATLMVAFPFMSMRFWSSLDAGKASNYPGIASAIIALGEEGGDFTFSKDGFTPGANSPPTIKTQEWTIYLNAEVIPPTQGETKTIRLGGSRVYIKNGDLVLDAPAVVLTGIRSQDLVLKGSKDEYGVFVESLIFKLATVEVPGAFISISGMLLLQNLVFVVILGLFLSVSGIPVRGLVQDGRYGPGVLASLKTAGILTLGPAVLSVLISTFVPWVGQVIGWLAYSLLYGVRIIMVYTARYRERKKTLGLPR